MCGVELGLQAREKYSCCERSHEGSVGVSRTSTAQHGWDSFWDTRAEDSAAAAPQRHGCSWASTAAGASSCHLWSPLRWRGPWLPGSFYCTCLVKHSPPEGAPVHHSPSCHLCLLNYCWLHHCWPLCGSTAMVYLPTIKYIRNRRYRTLVRLQNWKQPVLSIPTSRCKY